MHCARLTQQIPWIQELSRMIKELVNEHVKISKWKEHLNKCIFEMEKENF